MVSLIVIIEQTNFSLYPIKIRLEMAEIWPKVAKKLAMAIMGDQLVTSQMASLIVLIEQTDLLFYSIKIRLEMAEMQPKVEKWLAMAILGDQLVASQMASQEFLLSSALASTPTSVEAEVSLILTLHQISSGATQIGSGVTQISSGATGKVLELILINSINLVLLYE